MQIKLNDKGDKIIQRYAAMYGRSNLEAVVEIFEYAGFLMDAVASGKKVILTSNDRDFERLIFPMPKK